MPFGVAEIRAVYTRAHPHTCVRTRMRVHTYTFWFLIKEVKSVLYFYPKVLKT